MRILLRNYKTEAYLQSATRWTKDQDDFFFFSSRRRHTRFDCDWSSDVCSSDLVSPRSTSCRAMSRLSIQAKAGPANLIMSISTRSLERSSINDAISPEGVSRW